MAKILLVEDDPALRHILRNVLEIKGYHVQEADSKLSAEAILKSDSGIAVIILDLGLPPSPHTTVEGLAVIKSVIAQLHPAKIVVLTGQDEESSALAAIKEGAFDFLSKPSRSEAILNSVQRAVMFFENEKTLSDTEGLTRLQINARVADGLKAVREEAEEKLVRHVLKDTGFNVYQSAARLGLKRESIYYFLKKFGIKRDDG
ncbi:MAG: Fis family transcriptional regulator [SAR86 cluster bacterium]|uniref:Fis family transcriptional regulator n=1 Tax=SAR86 cluster bacterium TaxID=2030880 RepID=A0A2A5B4K6_9GAMM|nr:MAG: Fis family transcriptional regulator [SAR86 cluster bacterium]